MCTLQRLFPQDEHYGALVPLGYLGSSGRGIMITRHFRGSDLADHLRPLDASGMQGACHSAGLGCASCTRAATPAQSRVLGVADKLDYLATTYGAVLRGDRKTWAAYQYLEQTGSRIDARIFTAVRQHGDFQCSCPEAIINDLGN